MIFPLVSRAVKWDGKVLDKCRGMPLLQLCSNKVLIISCQFLLRDIESR